MQCFTAEIYGVAHARKVGQEALVVERDTGSAAMHAIQVLGRAHAVHGGAR